MIMKWVFQNKKEIFYNLKTCNFIEVACMGRDDMWLLEHCGKV